MILRAVGILSLSMTSMAYAQEIDPKPPAGWEAMNLWDALPGNGGAERLPLGCETGVDRELLAAGQRNMTVRCDGSVPRFGGLAQSFDAAEFRGKRIRFSALIRSEEIGSVRLPGNVPQWVEDSQGRGGLWVRILSERPDVPLSADTGFESGLTGTAYWSPAEVVLDVPVEATAIRIGFALAGRGQLWISDLTFEEVGTYIPVTGGPPSPTNLELKTN